MISDIIPIGEYHITIITIFITISLRIMKKRIIISPAKEENEKRNQSLIDLILSIIIFSTSNGIKLALKTLLFV